MLSIVVFSIGALSLGHFQGFLIQSTSLAKQRTEALLEVQNVIESLKIGKLEDTGIEGKKTVSGSLEKINNPNLRFRLRKGLL